MDNGQEFSLPSGAKLYVSVASFENIKALHDAVFGELRGKGIGELDLAEIQKVVRGEEGAGLGLLVDKIMSMVISKQVEMAIFLCAEKALYRHDGTESSSLQVTRGLFDNPKVRDQAREDFYAICLNIAKVNLQPFIKALSSMFMARVEKSAGTQK